MNLYWEQKEKGKLEIFLGKYFNIMAAIRTVAVPILLAILIMEKCS